MGGEFSHPQLIAEIGDTRRFHNREAITAFAVLDTPPYQSGTVDVKSKSISKHGFPHVCRALFLVDETYLKRKSADEPVNKFLDRKRSEGKLYS